MRPEPNLSPEDRATFDRLSAAMAAEAEAAPAGPPAAEQLTALTQAVQARGWRWVSLLARIGIVLPMIVVAAVLGAAAAGGLFLANGTSNHHPASLTPATTLPGTGSSTTASTGPSQTQSTTTTSTESSTTTVSAAAATSPAVASPTTVATTARPAPTPPTASPPSSPSSPSTSPPPPVTPTTAVTASPRISLAKNIDGQHEPTPPGLFVPAGDPVTFTYVVTNTGNVTLNPVTVADNQLDAITCPETVLAPAASQTCTAAGGPAAVGQRTNVGTATGQGVDDTGAPVGSPVKATDTANYFGQAPAIALVKDVNGQHEPTAPGLFVPVGEPVSFTYSVTNTGSVTLNRVTLADNVLGAITCPQTSLAVGDSETCTASGGMATAGQHTNTATVTGRGADSNGTPVGSPVTATDTANYFGSAPAITLVKRVNGHHEPTPPGLFVPVGEPVSFTYLVTNTGNTMLNVTVDDSVLGTVNCAQAPLAPDASETCTATGGNATAGEHSNTATATGHGVDNNGNPVGGPVTAKDTANYFGSAPAITLVKRVNGHHEPTPPGLFVRVGEPVSFTYSVTNTGNVTLNRVTLADNVLGAITCRQTSLEVGDSETCTASGGMATAGQHTNTATVTGRGADSNGTPVGSPVTATDTANYFGSAPAITLVKRVNGHHEPTPPACPTRSANPSRSPTWSRTLATSRSLGSPSATTCLDGSPARRTGSAPASRRPAPRHKPPKAVSISTRLP